MAQEVKLKVRLISYTKEPEKTVTAAIRQCYSSVGANQLLEKTDQAAQERLISLVTASGHTSTIEHASFTFAIEGISRACSHQLVRHRIASFSQQSQRYLDFSRKGISYIIPPNISYSKTRKKRFEEMMEEIEKSYQELI
ncbi:MAG: FAD-dependent thymidylate synthase, partial [Candidatus Shapirobacteria bacterium]|nr:FAD-dependent thymidylate synthase [Candidatus Shapirobacteria bacterium]